MKHNYVQETDGALLFPRVMLNGGVQVNRLVLQGLSIIIMALQCFYWAYLTVYKAHVIF